MIFAKTVLRLYVVLFVESVKEQVFIRKETQKHLTDKPHVEKIGQNTAWLVVKSADKRD